MHIPISNGRIEGKYTKQDWNPPEQTPNPLFPGPASGSCGNIIWTLKSFHTLIISHWIKQNQYTWFNLSKTKQLLNDSGRGWGERKERNHLAGPGTGSQIPCGWGSKHLKGRSHHLKGFQRAESGEISGAEAELPGRPLGRIWIGGVRPEQRLPHTPTGLYGTPIPVLSPATCVASFLGQLDSVMKFSS